MKYLNKSYYEDCPLRPDYSTDRPVTWPRMIAADPRLAELEGIIRSWPMEFECSVILWINRFKPQMETLVGWSRPDSHPLLSSNEAYERAYNHLYDPMPGCGPNCPHGD